MKQVTEKLKSQRGVSILYALLLFLVCAFVAGATLTAAYQAASRAPAARAEQQDYLAVASAAELVKTAVGGMEMTMTKTTDTTTVTAEDGTTTSATHTSTHGESTYTGDFSQIPEYVGKTFRGQAVTSEYDLTFSLGGHEALENVVGTLSMDATTYKVTVRLQNERDGGNAMTLTFTANSSLAGNITTDDGETVTTVTEVENLTVEWGEAVVSPATVP